MKIYTRRGDRGETGLYQGNRVKKNDLRIHACGTVDELNSSLGLARTHELPDDVQQTLSQIQHDLFCVGAELATPGCESRRHEWITPASVTRLESEIDRMDADLEPLQQFILPGGHPAAAQIHLARAVCRRAERWVVSLEVGKETVDDGSAVLSYLNRLSDLLFVMARWINHHCGVPDTQWVPPAKNR